MFSCEFCEISKNTFFIEQLWTTAAISALLLLSYCLRLSGRGSKLWIKIVFGMFQVFFLFSFCLQVVEAQYVLSFWKKLALSFKNVLDLQKDSDKFNFYKLLMKPFFTEQFPAYTSVLSISQVQSSKVPVNFVQNSKVLENFVQSSKVPGNFVQSSKVPVNFV